MESNENGGARPIVWDAAKAVLWDKIICITTALKKAKEQNLEDKLQHLRKQHTISHGCSDFEAN